MARGFWVSLTAAGALIASPHVHVSAQTVMPPGSAANLCGPLENAFGPFDYRTIAYENKRLVESAHFTPQVETLRAGQNGTIAGDLDYTLRAIPNHPRALMSMTRFAEIQRTSRPGGSRYPVECYFDRAVRFAPDDPMVRVLYGIFLAKARRSDEARQQLQRADSSPNTDPQIVYNLGIGYLELHDFERAKLYARKARDLGIPFSGLRDRLRRAGHPVD